MNHPASYSFVQHITSFFWERGKVGLICCLFFTCMPVTAQDEDLPGKMVYLPKMKGTTYEMLNMISEKTGYLFMYDSKVINSNRNVKIPEGTYTLKDAIAQATADKAIRTRVIDSHILLYKEEITPLPQSKSAPLPPDQSYTALEGIVRDKDTNEPVAYCSVSITEAGTGTVTNQNGQFLLKLPGSLQNAYIKFSHIGYETQHLPAQLFSDNKTDVYLNTRLIPIEAVIIRLVNPMKLVKDMLDNRQQNYTNEPYYLTSFYREGVNHKRGFTNLTEAVFRVYKPGYSSAQSEQVKMIKMRSISNKQETDTVAMKMKAGVNACLMLDIIKNIPDFLMLNDENMYNYTKIAMAVTGDRLAHVVAFEQKPGIRGPLYKGELYIDESNYALLYAHFHIHPDYIQQAHSMFVVKKSRNLEITPMEAVYSVSYQQWNGKYYVNHSRGDLTFKVKKKKRFLAGTSTSHTWFEMATCHIDTLNVKRFPTRESQPTQNIFSETNYVYDESFWGDFNIIMPEEKLSDAISRISSKIEESIEK